MKIRFLGCGFRNKNYLNNSKLKWTYLVGLQYGYSNVGAGKNVYSSIVKSKNERIQLNSS